jgi:hypothetical protein
VNFITIRLILPGILHGGLASRYFALLVLSCVMLRLSQMWETAERAGMITANLMWWVFQVTLLV